jgi:hypothetical protein
MPISNADLQELAKVSLDEYLRNMPVDQIATERPLLKKLMSGRKTFLGAKQNVVENIRKSYGSNFAWAYGEDKVSFNKRNTTEQAQFPWRRANDGLYIDYDRLFGIGITVREGCRGEFALMGTPPSGWNDQGSGEIEMRCDSDDGREAFCAINNRGIRLTRTLSRAPCVEGNTWRADSRGIYVRGGCRGQFVARTGNDGGWSGGGGGSWGNNNSGGGWGNNNGGGGFNQGSAPYQIRCQSIGGRWGACPVQINGKVRLVRRESHVFSSAMRTGRNSHPHGASVTG